jgi:hypothetical protein
MVGVSDWNPDEDRLESVLMSPEGLVLFMAAQTGTEIVVEQSVPPLDNPGFAAGLFDDIRFLFVPWKNRPAKVGTGPAGEQICRWVQRDFVRDLSLFEEGAFRLAEYTASGQLQRLSHHLEVDSSGQAREVDFTVHGVAGYRMLFQRVEQ